MLQEFIDINKDLDIAIIVNAEGFNEDYILNDVARFRSTIDKFNKLTIPETSIDYVDYLDVRIRIGKILTNLQDKAFGDFVSDIIPYNHSLNSLSVAERIYGSKDRIVELYKINSVNTDYEMLTSEYIIIPNLRNI